MLAGFYDVRFEDAPGDLRSCDQLAFAVCPDRFDIVVGRFGHGKLTRGRDRHEWQGGWVFPSKGKIYFTSGLLKDVEDRSGVQAAIESALGMNLVAR